MAKYSKRYKKYSKRLKRVLKRKSKKTPKYIRKEIKKTIMRTVESKFAFRDLSYSSTTSGTAWDTTGLTHTTIYPDIDQGPTRSNRIGNKIIIKKFRIKYMLQVLGSSLVDWNYRIIIWKPKLMSDYLTASGDVTTSLTGAALNISNPMWNSEDVTIHIDTGVKHISQPSINGQYVKWHTFYVPSHTITYSTNTTVQPDDRMYCISIFINNGGSSQAWSSRFRSDVLYKDM